MATSKKKETDGQSNIGYENTEVRTDSDEKDTGRMPTATPGKENNPEETKSTAGGLRSESGKKTQGKKATDTE